MKLREVAVFKLFLRVGVVNIAFIAAVQNQKNLVTGTGICNRPPGLEAADVFTTAAGIISFAADCAGMVFVWIHKLPLVGVCTIILENRADSPP